MGHYLTYVLVPKGTPEGNVKSEQERLKEIAETCGPISAEFAAAAALSDPVRVRNQLLSSDQVKVEDKVAMLMEPYRANLLVAAHRKECDCLRHNATKEVQKLGQYKVQGVSSVFTREEFAKPGVELEWKRQFQSSGAPRPDCEQCGGTGYVISHDNPGSKWDSWEIGTGFAKNILKDSVKGETSNQNIARVKDLDLDKLPTPNHLLLPDGQWFSDENFLWSSALLVIDENWDETVKNLLSQHEEEILVAVNIHC